MMLRKVTACNQLCFASREADGVLSLCSWELIEKGIHQREKSRPYRFRFIRCIIF